MPWLGANGLLPGRGEPPSRPPPRRSPCGRSLRPMPWLELNGLLPGRGAPGRGPGRPAPGRSLRAGAAGAGFGAAGPGFAPGALGAGAGVAASGFGVAGFASAGLGAWASRLGSGDGAGAGVSAFGAGLDAGAFGPGLGAPGFAADGVAFFAGALDLSSADSPPAFVGFGGFSLILRTTGASIVELADFTNSPCALRCARSSLLSTPSSLASSWTRTLATFLLSVFDGPPRLRARQTVS